jgi:hypothetical protein
MPWHLVVVTDPQRPAALESFRVAPPARTWSGVPQRPPRMRAWADHILEVPLAPRGGREGDTLPRSPGAAGPDRSDWSRGEVAENGLFPAGACLMLASQSWRNQSGRREYLKTVSVFRGASHEIQRAW